MLQRVTRLIFPDECLLCRDLVEAPGALCGACWRNTPFTLGLSCDLCGAPVLGEDTDAEVHCEACRAADRPWHKGRAVMLYADGARRLILGLKHGDRVDLAPALAGWMAARAEPLLEPDTLIVPVPLHWRRLFARRYNQAGLLANHLGREVDREVCPDLLERTRKTAPQDGMGVDARFENLSGAIRVAPRHLKRIQDRPILLVDDVMTSGATLATCTEACHAAGSGQVCVIVLARVCRDP